uniref:Uncharacterized protein n=1 Tax=Romanomermis culicivorax TaxID=13658 RepID=A0A915J2Z8_ROMCU
MDSDDPAETLDVKCPGRFSYQRLVRLDGGRQDENVDKKRNFNHSFEDKDDECIYEQSLFCQFKQLTLVSYSGDWRVIEC